jgi:hypothetical protein
MCRTGHAEIDRRPRRTGPKPPWSNLSSLAQTGSPRRIPVRSIVGLRNASGPRPAPELDRHSREAGSSLPRSRQPYLLHFQFPRSPSMSPPRFALTPTSTGGCDHSRLFYYLILDFLMLTNLAGAFRASRRELGSTRAPQGCRGRDHIRLSYYQILDFLI